MRAAPLTVWLVLLASGATFASAQARSGPKTSCAEVVPSGEAQSDGASTEVPEWIFPVSFAVASVEGAPVVSRAWLADQLAWANRIFAPSGVAFRVAGIRPLEERHARLEDRADRHALGAEQKDGVIDIFIVASLRDVDEPDRLRMGVHWRPRGHPGTHFVIVSAIAGPTVLAHELGHFFGNRQHPETPGNIMSYTRGEGDPFFDAAQIASIRRFARKFVQTGELPSVRP